MNLHDFVPAHVRVDTARKIGEQYRLEYSLRIGHWPINVLSEVVYEGVVNYPSIYLHKWMYSHILVDLVRNCPYMVGAADFCEDEAWDFNLYVYKPDQIALTSRNRSAIR
jgi:hypothetical protein